MRKTKASVCRVVEAIGQLRKRRTTPDFVQIAHYLEKQYGMKEEAVRIEVDRLVEECVITLSEHKGAMIYSAVTPSNTKKSVADGIDGGASFEGDVSMEYGAEGMAADTPSTSSFLCVTSDTPSTSSSACVTADTPSTNGSFCLTSNTPSTSSSTCVTADTPSTSSSACVTANTPSADTPSTSSSNSVGSNGSKLTHRSLDQHKIVGQGDLIAVQSKSHIYDDSISKNATAKLIAKEALSSTSAPVDLVRENTTLIDESSTDEEGVFEKRENDDEDEDSSSEQVECRLIKRSVPSSCTARTERQISKRSEAHKDTGKLSHTQLQTESLLEDVNSSHTGLLEQNARTDSPIHGTTGVDAVSVSTSKSQNEGDTTLVAQLGCETLSASGGDVMVGGVGRGKRKSSVAGGKRKKSKRSHMMEQDVSSMGLKRPRCDSDANSTGSKGSTSAAGVAKCDFCQQTSQRNKLGVREDLLVCKDCDAKAHPSCMDYSEELSARAARSPWQCMECKTCNVCNDSGDADAMLFCDSCDKGFHMNCHSPPILDKPKGKWVCCKCVLEQRLTQCGDDSTSCVDKLENLKAETDVNKNHILSNVDGEKSILTVSLPTPTASPLHFLCSSTDKLASAQLLNGTSVTTTNGLLTVSKSGEPECLPRLSTTLTGAVPDASEWSPAQVGQYFYGLGFLQQSHTFIDQEIDGRALLLLTRSDVLTGLSLKLGPALKIYAHIQRLQSWTDSV